MMGLSSVTIWWVAAGIAVAAELATGTFYLLMMALGFAAGAIAAHLGLSESAQVVCAAVVGGGATALWHWRRTRRPQKLPAREDRDVNLDIGERVQVAEWAPDGTARVTYRGSGWPARLARGAAARSGEHDIVAVEGNWLVLAPRTGPGPN
jgi:membrane protein implicated in regulation of membrane protease activity